MAGLRVTFVTGNEKKRQEVSAILASAAIQIDMRKLDLPELQGSSTREIAEEKCRLAAREVGGPVLTEDTSLCFEALGGLPGPYIKVPCFLLAHFALFPWIAFHHLT